MRSPRQLFKGSAPKSPPTLLVGAGPYKLATATTELRHFLYTQLNPQEKLEQLNSARLTHQHGHKQSSPNMQGLKW
jgi:hypothetical protein